MTYLAKSKSDEWQTPDWLYRELELRFSFTVDVAANNDNCKQRHRKYFTDGLKTSWEDERVFCNPPFSKKKKWIAKAKQEVKNGCPICVMILPCTMEVLREIKDYHYDILPYRVSFIDPDTNEPIKGNTHGTVIVYFWGEIKRDVR